MVKTEVLTIFKLHINTETHTNANKMNEHTCPVRVVQALGDV